MAHALTTSVLLLCACLGACPQVADAAQRTGERKPLPPPLLPAEEAWNVTLPSPPSAAAALDESRAYVPLQSGQVVALNRETGKTEWSIALSTMWAPAVDAGVVYMAADGEFQAVRAADGGVLWRTTLDSELSAAPAVLADRIFLLVKPDQLRALRASDGSEIWRRSIGPLSAPPAMIANEAGVFLSSGSRVIRFAPTDGNSEWERELSGTLSPPSVGGNRVFVGSTDNYLYALETATGRLAYRSRAGGDVVGAAADDEFVYVASLDNLLRGLRRGNGNQVWKHTLTTRTIAPPSTFGGIVLLTGNEPTMTSFDASTGMPIATLSLAADVQGVPLVDTSLQPFRVALVVVTRDARAIGLRPTGMMFREPPVTPLQALPGRPLSREPLTLQDSQSPTLRPQPAAPELQSPTDSDCR